MRIDKYNRKALFILTQLKDKANELKIDTIPEEMKNYNFKNLANELISISKPVRIVNPINSNLIVKNTVEDIFNNTINALTTIDVKIEELKFLNNNLNDNIENVIMPLFTKVNNLTTKKTKINSSSSSVVDEHFNNKKFFENKYCSLKNSFLELSNDEIYNEFYAATIEVTNSNGLPGDTHRAFIENNEVSFNGEEELSINLNNIFSKSKSLVYETISIPSSEYKKTNGYGFKYNENISYLNNDKSLHLDLKITFSSPKKMNIIKFNDSQISNYVIKSIKIIDENGYTTTIADSKNSCVYNIFNFKECNVVSILLSFIQYNKEKTYIGHFYKASLKESDNSYKIEYEDVKIGSILNLGVTIDSNNKIKHGKTTTTNDSSTNKENNIKKSLYNNELDRELILAERASISINSFNCFLKKYKQNGVCIFKYDFKNNIKSVTFDANEFMPKATSILYYISFDNNNWHSIKPLYRVGNDEIHTIALNSVITSSNINSKTIFTNDKQYTIYLKVELKTADVNVSPIVNSITLKVRE